MLKRNNGRLVIPKHRVRVARAEARETQEEVASILNVTKETYNQKETGNREFTILEGIVLSLHFNKSLDYLFMPTDVSVLECIKEDFSRLGT